MNQIDKIISENPALLPCKAAMEQITAAIVCMHENGGKLLLCGNGGSAADCEHISGELLKGFLSKRPLPEDSLTGLEDELRAKLQRGIGAVPLTSLSALGSAFANDVDPALSYAQAVLALGQKNDVVLGISTSGNAKNVAAALKVARAMGLKTLAMTGEKGGLLKEIADVTLAVPETETYKVQQLHLPAYHAICAEVERILFDH
jgi:D-sedoheptulose 7-phosphate isomerase